MVGGEGRGGAGLSPIPAAVISATDSPSSNGVVGITTSRIADANAGGSTSVSIASTDANAGANASVNASASIASVPSVAALEGREMQQAQAVAKGQEKGKDEEVCLASLILTLI